MSPFFSFVYLYVGVLCYADFDAIEDLHGGLGALKLPPPEPTSHEYGAYLRQQRQQREASEPSFNIHDLCTHF